MEGSRWLSYNDMAKALGITPDSARRLVARKRWPRQQGNDGRTLVAVPSERLPPDNAPDASPDDPSDTRGDFTPDIPPAVAPDVSGVLTVLTRHIERLEAELAAAVSERDVERTRAAQGAVLEAVLEIERTRLTESRQEAERWREVATAPGGLWAWFKRA